MNSSKLVSNHKFKLIKIIFSLLIPNNFIILIKNIISFISGYSWDNYIFKNNLKYADLILKTLSWIKHSQDKVGSGGVGCYELYRWTKGYPEVTGYIIPTIWDCYYYFKDKELDRTNIICTSYRNNSHL